MQHIYCKEELINQFKKIGVTQGMNLILHSSLGSLGYVVNGANDVIEALLEIIGRNGTLLMPSHSGDKTDPADWKNPSVPKKWVKKIRRHMLPFDTKATPIRNRGIIPEVFLLYPGVYRSNHPIASLAAKGKMAKRFTETHPLHQSEGINSPIGSLYKHDGYALLLGVDLSSNTSFHLAEYLADVPYLSNSGVKVLVVKKKNNVFVKLKKYPTSSRDFINIERDLLKHKLMKIHKINGTTIRFMKLKPAIDFVVNQLAGNPYYLKKR